MKDIKNYAMGLVSLLNISSCAIDSKSRCDTDNNYTSPQSMKVTVNNSDSGDIYSLSMPMQVTADNIEENILTSKYSYDLGKARKENACAKTIKLFIDPNDSEVQYSRLLEVCNTNGKGADAYVATRKGLYEKMPVEVVLRLPSIDDRLTEKCLSFVYTRQPCCEEATREAQVVNCNDVIKH